MNQKPHTSNLGLAQVKPPVLGQAPNSRCSKPNEVWELPKGTAGPTLPQVRGRRLLEKEEIELQSKELSQAPMSQD